MRLTKPPAIRLNSARLCLVFALLEGSSLDDLSVLVTNGLAPALHLKSSNLLGIVVEVLPLDLLQRDLGPRGRGLGF